MMLHTTLKIHIPNTHIIISKIIIYNVIQNIERLNISNHSVQSLSYESSSFTIAKGHIFFSLYFRGILTSVEGSFSQHRSHKSKSHGQNPCTFLLSKPAGTSQKSQYRVLPGLFLCFNLCPNGHFSFEQGGVRH